MPVVPAGGGAPVAGGSNKLNGSFNGLTFGRGADYHVAGMEGFWDLPEIHSTDVPKATGTGWFAGMDREGRRIVVMTFHLIAATDTAYDTLVQGLIAAMAVQPTAQPALRFWDYTRYLYCRPRRRTIPVDCGTLQRTGTAVIEFVATNPTVYSGSPP